jgi:hypothetical protein
MLALKLLLNLAGALMLIGALASPLYTLTLRLIALRRKSAEPAFTPELEPKPPIPFGRLVALAVAGCVPLLLAASIVVVPSGFFPHCEPASKQARFCTRRSAAKTASMWRRFR